MNKEFFKFIKIYPQEYIDIYPTQIGFQWIKKQSCRNVLKDSYILHIILKGKGYFKSLNKNYLVEKNQAFLIMPGKMISYYADSQDPWSYLWIGFDGKGVKNIFKNKNIDINNQVFTLKNLQKIKKIMKMIFSDINSLGNECETKIQGFKEIGVFFLIMEEFFNQISKDENIIPNDLVDRISFYINNNLKTVTVTDICEEFIINRTSLFRLFKAKFAISPQEYIMKTKMTYAMELIRNTDIPFKTIAISIGYLEYERFSRAFKKYYQESPKEIRHKRLLGII